MYPYQENTLTANSRKLGARSKIDGLVACFSQEGNFQALYKDHELVLSTLLSSGEPLHDSQRQHGPNMVLQENLKRWAMQSATSLRPRLAHFACCVATGSGFCNCDLFNTLCAIQLPTSHAVVLPATVPWNPNIVHLGPALGIAFDLAAGIPSGTWFNTGTSVSELDAGKPAEPEPDENAPSGVGTALLAYLVKLGSDAYGC